MELAAQPAFATDLCLSCSLFPANTMHHPVSDFSDDNQQPDIKGTGLAGHLELSHAWRLAYLLMDVDLALSVVIISGYFTEEVAITAVCLLGVACLVHTF